MNKMDNQVALRQLSNFENSDPLLQQQGKNHTSVTLDNVEKQGSLSRVVILQVVGEHQGVGEKKWAVSDGNSNNRTTIQPPFTTTKQERKLGGVRFEFDLSLRQV